MNIIEMLVWLIGECHKHNGSYHHTTDKAKLAHCEQQVRFLEKIFSDELNKIENKGLTNEGG